MIDMSEEPACVEAHHGKAYDESLGGEQKWRAGQRFHLRQERIRRKDFRDSRDTRSPSIRSGCWFRPRVMGIQTGQILQVINSDPVTHNIHPMAQVNREWNHSQGAGRPAHRAQIHQDRKS